jgi:hypothetical protein
MKEKKLDFIAQLKKNDKIFANVMEDKWLPHIREVVLILIESTGKTEYEIVLLMTVYIEKDAPHNLDIADWLIAAAVLLLEKQADEIMPESLKEEMNAYYFITNSISTALLKDLASQPKRTH